MIKKVSDLLEMFRRKMKMSKRIVLPDREEMLKRFIEKDKDGHRQKYFYPLLLKKAGRRKSAEGVFKMLLHAIIDYLEKIPPHAKDMVAGIMFTCGGGIIDMLIEDKEVRQKAKGLLEATAEATAEAVIDIV